MKKTIAKKTSSKKAQPQKKVVAKKPVSKNKQNVVAFKKPKAHPFAAFMKDRWSARSFSGHTRKMGSQDTYRKKAV
jgi:hypothetical protein